ncbi:MAG: excinuclease ABC subunit UvrC [Elusimicrobia bacterium]|nr:excinuclease ABC subunit UvrC [Elusimicrobiota bacterium]
MKDAKAKILYIGKAKNLQKRVSSYFQRNQLSPKIKLLVPLIIQIDYIPTNSEQESLLLEQKLIRQNQPFYNTLWRDDKSYPYLKLTLNEDYPCLFFTRSKKKDGSKYFGPYPQVNLIKKLIHSLWRKKMFPLRPCKFDFKEDEILKKGGLQNNNPNLYKKVQSCIYLHTGECPAPCVGRISKKNYGAIAEKTKLFFEGKLIFLKEKLEKNMKQLSQSLHFEEAGKLRDQIQAINYIFQKVTVKKIDQESILKEIKVTRSLRELQKCLRLKIPPIRIEAFDISNIQGQEPVASLVVFEKGKPLKSDYRKFKIKTVKGPNDFAMIREVVERRYKRVINEGKNLPDLILIDGGKGQLSSGLEAINNIRDKRLQKVPVISLAKKNEEIFLPNQPDPIQLPLDSTALHILQWIRDEAHRFAITFHRKRFKKFLLNNP